VNTLGSCRRDDLVCMSGKINVIGIIISFDLVQVLSDVISVTLISADPVVNFVILSALTATEVQVASAAISGIVDAQISLGILVSR